MDCTEVNQKIELFVLGELHKSERAAVKAHLAVCPDCNAAEADYRLLINGIAQAARPDPLKRDFSQRTRSAAAAEIRSIARRARLHRIFAVTASAAACFLLVLVARQARILPTGKDVNVFTNDSLEEVPAQSSSGATAPSVLQAWQYRCPLSVPGSTADEVIVRGQDLYLLQENSGRTSVAAIDTRTGEQKWISGIRSCGYLLADDLRVYCLSPGSAGELELIALNAAGGQPLWKYQHQSAEQQTPCRPILLSGGRICWTTDNAVHMISRANGKALWTHSISDGGLLSSAVVMNDELFVSTSAGLCCLNAETGGELWKLDYSDVKSSRSRPLLTAEGDEIYASVNSGLNAARLIRIEPQRRTIVWAKTVPHVSHLYAIDDIIYVRSQNIQALNAATGRLLWSCPATGCNPVTYSDRLAYFVDSRSRGSLKALDRHTGSKVWELSGVKSCNAFITVNNIGFLKSQDGTIYEINLKG
jgi:hypothetical protein